MNSEKNDSRGDGTKSRKNPADMNLSKFFENNSDSELLVIEATVPTGFEKIALSEIKEKVNIFTDEVISGQGRIYFVIRITEYSNIMNLRSVDNIYLVIFHIHNMEFTDNEEEDMNKIKNLVYDHDIIPTINKWVELTNFQGILNPTRNEHDIAKTIKMEVKEGKKDYKYIEKKNTILKYRVTCNRSMVHSFSSVKAQSTYGGHINDKYNWLVDLVNFDLNINLNIYAQKVTVTLNLTKSSLHRRCLLARGPTALRPTIAYNMLRDCKIEPGNIVVDPLCGGGSIPIEAVYGFPNCIVFCGDIDERAIERSEINIGEIDLKFYKPQLFKWDSTNLPFPDKSIDVICSDLPFGKRCKEDLRLLYRSVLDEFARVIKCNGVVCLLVNKPHLIIRIVNNKSYPLCLRKQLTVNIGGMKCATMYLSYRSSKI